MTLFYEVTYKPLLICHKVLHWKTMTKDRTRINENWLNNTTYK